MTRKRTVIIDDEPRNIKLVERLVKEHCPQLDVVGTADNLTEGLQMIRELKPALMFLDIEFPTGTVFSILGELPVDDFQVIFITAHNSYATEAFRQNAVDYVLKPLTKEMLVEAVKRAETRSRDEEKTDISKLMQELKAGWTHPKKVALPTAEGILFINEVDITRCEASGRYTIIYLAGGKKVTVAKTLKETEALLHSKLFFRVHHSHLINLEMVKKYHRDRMAELVDGSLVEVSLSRKDEFLDMLTRRDRF